MTAPGPLLARALRLQAGRRPLLSVDALQLEPGTMVALVGPNGSGKSTLLRALAGLTAPSSGEVLLGDTPVAALAAGARARHIGLLTQHPDVPFPFSALETVLLGRTPHLGLFGLPAPDDIVRARALLGALEVGPLAEAPLAQLSGGERQRVHVARALIQDTPVLLLDEPTSAQDFRGTALILRELRARARSGGLVVMALHDLNLAPRHFDRVLLIAGGVVQADGVPGEVLRPAALRRAWGDGLEVSALADGSPVVRAQLLGPAAAAGPPPQK